MHNKLALVQYISKASSQQTFQVVLCLKYLFHHNAASISIICALPTQKKNQTQMYSLPLYFISEGRIQS